MIETLTRIDTNLLNAFRSIIDPSSAWQVGMVKFGTDLEVVLVVLVLVGLWLYGAYKKKDNFKEEALMIFYSIAFAFGIYVVLNLGLPERPRPETVSAIRPLVDHLPDNSFPSGHAIFFGASVLSAFYYSRRWIGWLLLVSGLYMVLSRVLAGIHYPGDILAGAVIGCVGAYVIHAISGKKIFSHLLVYPIRLARFFRL